MFGAPEVRESKQATQLGQGLRVASYLREWPLLPILLLAAWLRLGWPGITQFSYDEARLSTLALDWVRGGPVPLAGMISSVGFHFPPINVYLLALPYALSEDPMVATAFIALLNVIAVVGCYLLARRWYGWSAAWTSALLFAANPWAVLYSRNLWANCMLPPFVLLSVTSGYLALVEGRARWLAVLPLAVALTVQIHISGMALLIWAIVALILFRRRVRLRLLLVGTLLAALTWLPYLLYQAQNWREELAAIRGSARAPARIDLELFAHMWRMTTGKDIHSLAGPARFRAFLDALPPYEWLFSLAGLLFLLALGWLVWQAGRSTEGRQREIAILLLLWLAAPIPLYLRHSLPVYTHYLIVLFPAMFLAIGGGIATLTHHRPRLAAAGVTIILCVSVAQATVFGTLLEFVGSQATPGGLGTPLHYWREAAERIRGAPVCEVKIFGTGAWPLYHTEPAIFDTILYDDPRRLFFDVRQAEDRPVYEDGRTLIVLPPPPDDTPAVMGELMQAPSALPPVTLRPGEGEIYLLYHDGGRSEARMGRMEPAYFANGMALLGYGTSGSAVPGGTLRLFLNWQLIDPPEGDLYVYNHLLDGAGNRWGQADGYICARNQWHDGQRVWIWYDIPIDPAASPGPYRIRTGLYSYPDIVNIDVLDATGQPVDNGVTLELN